MKNHLTEGNSAELKDTNIMKIIKMSDIQVYSSSSFSNTF